jgi:hypothetical protein
MHLGVKQIAPIPSNPEIFSRRAAQAQCEKKILAGGPPFVFVGALLAAPGFRFFHRKTGVQKTGSKIRDIGAIRTTLLAESKRLRRDSNRFALAISQAIRNARFASRIYFRQAHLLVSKFPWNGYSSESEGMRCRLVELAAARKLRTVLVFSHILIYHIVMIISIFLFIFVH